MFRCRVRFLIDWRECMRDDIKTVRRQDARELVEQGIAVYVKPNKKIDKKFEKKKNFKEASADRMLKGASVSK